MAGIGAGVVGLALVVHLGCRILLIAVTTSESSPKISVISEGSIGTSAPGAKEEEHLKKGPF
jgi:hypothetical protein